MRRENFKSLNTLLVLLCFLTACSGGCAQGTNIGLLMKGNLMILPSTGAASKPRVATAAEKQAWKQQSSMVSATSPDGKYRAEKVEGEGIGPSFQIVNASNGNVVLGSDVIENLSGQAMGETVFDGWFPDSRHFAAITHSHISSQENYTR
ncbi:MAG: hypothetical protein CO095_03265, partial [Armatimonadetes bacterium CG_4_9_14_3_um_filter_58_7]